jgi:4-hydroxybenzoate polyprenyltransferase
VRAYLQLVRAPNLITAAADVVAGFSLMTWLADAPFGHPRWHKLAALAFVSMALYASGVIFNDCLDAEKDLRHRPDRPIPSGAVPLGRAFLLGAFLTLVALIVAMFLSWATVVCAGALIVCIWAYNLPLRRTALTGALAMGSCRFLNMLLGMSTGTSMSYFSFRKYPDLVLAPALLGTYVVIVTLVSTYEDRPAGRSAAWVLVGSAVGMGAVLLTAMLGLVGTLAGQLLLAALLVVLVGIFVMPLMKLTFASVRRAVGLSVMLIIAFDAALVLGVRDAPAWLGLGTLGAMAPAWLLARKIAPS